jgi:two-component system NtrC family sensor kinase
MVFSMKLPSYGLRAGILTQLIFLIVAAMLLVNVAMLNFHQRDLISAKGDMGRLLIGALAQKTGNLLETGKRGMKDLDSDINFKRDISELLSNGGYLGLVIVDHNGEPAISVNLSPEAKERGLNLARITMETMAWSVNYYGITWGVLWLAKNEISISSPLIFNGRSLGGININAPLQPIYQSIRESEKFILFYIILDTIILALVGIYLLSRIVVKPIHKLLRMTEEYKDGDIIPSMAEYPGNEIGNLSRSFGVMLRRLDDNKKELKTHISLLEEANRRLKEAQREIISSEKLASVGRLAAGIAHEIGNPIGIILGYLEMIRKGNITDLEKKDFMDRVQTEITRVNRIINQLLDFARPSSGKKEEGRVHELLSDTVNMIRPQSIMEEIKINLDFRASKDKVLADPNQLHQVFLNIILNAVDALSRDGLTEGKEKKELRIMSENPNKSIIEIRFIDNGPGIAEEELIHIFDPFYTTKEPGKGTGLGLSVCYWIVEGQGGEIRAESVMGKGTTIIVSLPLHGLQNGGDGQ